MTKSINLYYNKDGSNKFYNISIEEESTGFVVNFSYGRVGNAAQNGTKTLTPIHYSTAKKLFDKIIAEKTGKGYIPDSNGKPLNVTSSESRDTGIRPQLLNEISEGELEIYLANDDWCAQEKFDGRRRMFVVRDGAVTGTNRKGLSIPIDKDLEREASLILDTGILDGEDMGDHIMLFDQIVTGIPYRDRYKRLTKINRLSSLTKLKLVYTAWTTKEKRALYKKLKKDNAEGIVFKNVNAWFTPGRPNSGGEQLKLKFVATATCMVGKVNTTKRSISVNVFDEDHNVVNVGNVTVYPNQDIPEPGSIVEIKYLYYFQGGSLFQPVLIGLREDMDPDDCTLKQLKLKREEVES